MNRADYTLSSPATSLGAIAMLAAGIVIALLVHWLFFWFAQRVVRRTRREADDAILAALYQPARWLIALIGFGAALAPIRLGPTPRCYLPNRSEEGSGGKEGGSPVSLWGEP